MEKKYVKDNTEYLVKVIFEEKGWPNSCFVFKVDLLIRQKGKRKWNDFIDTDAVGYRSLGLDEREKERETLILAEIPYEWLDEVRQLEIDRLKECKYEF